MRVTKEFYDKVECASIIAEAGFFGSAVSSAASRMLLPTKIGNKVGLAASVSFVMFWGVRSATSHAVKHFDSLDDEVSLIGGKNCVSDEDSTF